MRKDMSRPRFWFTFGNLLWLIAILLILGVSFYFQQQTNLVNQQTKQITKELRSERTKYADLQNIHERVVYLPKAGDLQLTQAQQESVSDLTSLFNRITTFDNTTSYETNYRKAKQKIHDPKFYTEFLPQAVGEDGVSTVNVADLKMKHVRTAVLVAGPDTYQVYVTYVPYHNTSDLYQLNKLKTMTRVFDVQGQPGNYLKVVSNDDIISNGVQQTVGAIE